VDIVVAGVAVIAFAATVFVLANVGGHTRTRQARTILLPDPDDPTWMTVQQVATLLELPPSEVVELAHSDAIPFWLVRGGRLSEPEYLRFRRDEIEAWTIG
jgi:excisionase family DNA binding protein